MLSSQEQMEIIKGALSEDYKGPIFKLIEQAEIKKQEESEQTEEPEQRETGGLVQSYAPTPPNVGSVLTGPKIGKGKFLENAEQYRGGGFKKYMHAGVKHTDPPKEDNRKPVSVKTMSDLRKKIYKIDERNLAEDLRVSKVRSNVPSEAKKLDEADESDVLFGKNGTSGMTKRKFLDSDYFTAKNSKELKKAIKNLPEAIKNVLPQKGNYNLGVNYADSDGEFAPGLHPERELYCTPYGCFPYQEAGATDLPTIGGNYSFVNLSKNEKLPFEKIPSSEREIGDMQILYNDAPADYSDHSKGRVYRPHHTTIFNGESDEKGGFGGWNALNGNRFSFDESYWDSVQNETPEYYRYVGQTRQNKRELAELEEEIRSYKLKIDSKMDKRTPNISSKLKNKKIVNKKIKQEVAPEKKSFFENLNNRISNRKVLYNNTPSKKIKKRKR